MHAVFLNAHGSYDALIVSSDFPTPPPGPGEALVRVHATTLNRIDTLMRGGYPGITLPFPHVPGADIAGAIASAPAGSGWREGDRVLAYPVVHCGECEWCRKGRTGLCVNWKFFGMHRWGAYAEYVAVPLSCLIRIPDALSFETAATLPCAGLTAYHAMFTLGKLEPGETYFQWGGAGGMGPLAISMAKHFGARVIVTTSTDEKAAVARASGADVVLNHLTDDVVAEVMKLTGGQGPDVVMDFVGPLTFDRSWKMVRRGGRILLCGRISGVEVTLHTGLTYLRHLSILGVYLGDKSELESLVALAASGAVKPHISEIVPLQDVARYHERMEKNELIGKVVMRFD